MIKLWVKFGEANATQVSTKGCDNVNDFIKAIKKNLPNPLYEISLTEGGVALRPDMPINEIPEIDKNDHENPLFISVNNGTDASSSTIVAVNTSDQNFIQSRSLDPQNKGDFSKSELPPNTDDTTSIVKQRNSATHGLAKEKAIQELAGKSTHNPPKQYCSVEILEEKDFENELVKFWAANKEIIMKNLNFEFPTDTVAKDRKSRFSLLLHNLPEKGEKSFFESGKEFRDVHKDNLTVIVGPSGAGKTRSIFEYLCSHYGFYLLAENDEYVNYGSRDLASLYTKAVSKLDINNQAKNSEFVESYMSCVLASRIHLFLELAKEVGFTPKKWLLVQILLDSRNDYFLNLADIFRRASKTVLGKLCKRFINSKLLEENMPVFIYDAQTMLFKLENFFPGTTRSGCSLYNAVGKSVMKGEVGNIANSSIFALVVSGTALSLHSAAYLSSSSINKVLYRTIEIQEYFDEESVKKFFLCHYGKEIDDDIAYWLRGRPSIVCNFIETLLEKGEGVDIQLALNQYKEDKTSNMPRSYYAAYHALAHKVNDEHRKLELYPSVKRALYDFMITGRPVIHCSNNFIQTFEAGFSRLSTVDGKTGVMMDEPIPALTGFKYFSDSDHFMQNNELLKSLAYEAGPLGVAWERYLLDNLRNYFENVESKFKLTREYIGCTSSIFCPEEGVEFKAKKSGEDYTLANFQGYFNGVSHEKILLKPLPIVFSASI